MYEDGSWIDARTLHKELGVGKKFTDWIKGKISKYDFIEDEDYKICFPKRESKKGSGGHNVKDYSLTLDMAKELSMVENNKGVYKWSRLCCKGVVKFNIPSKEDGEKFRSVNYSFPTVGQHSKSLQRILNRIQKN